MAGRYTWIVGCAPLCWHFASAFADPNRDTPRGVLWPDAYKRDAHRKDTHEGASGANVWWDMAYPLEGARSSDAFHYGHQDYGQDRHGHHRSNHGSDGADARATGGGRITTLFYPRPAATTKAGHGAAGIEGNALRNAPDGPQEMKADEAQALTELLHEDD